MQKANVRSRASRRASGAPLEALGNNTAPTDQLEQNRKIIALLQQDGRMPYSTIAAEVGVSEGTVRNRVRQLLDDHVITIQAEALPEAFGYSFNAVTFLKVAAGTDINAVADRIATVPEVYYLIMMLGQFDLGVATYHRSHEDFREFLTRHCYGQQDVAAVETSMVLKVHKMKLQWDLGANHT
jgi:Lrp/AsnC family transcriptional regulator, regulator for asnA, asnC and gidA